MCTKIEGERKITTNALTCDHEVVRSKQRSTLKHTAPLARLESHFLSARGLQLRLMFSLNTIQKKIILVFDFDDIVSRKKNKSNVMRKEKKKNE